MLVNQKSVIQTNSTENSNIVCGNFLEQAPLPAGLVPHSNESIHELCLDSLFVKIQQVQQSICNNTSHLQTDDPSAILVKHLIRGLQCLRFFLDRINDKKNEIEGLLSNSSNYSRNNMSYVLNQLSHQSHWLENQLNQNQYEIFLEGIEFGLLPLLSQLVFTLQKARVAETNLLFDK